jgi:RHS repeat-associated protein
VQQGSAGYANDIDPASNRLQRAAGPGGTRNFIYDAEGNIKTDGTLSFEFALHGRMRSGSGPAGKTTYWYNALGQRVRKTGQDTTYYFYDGEGRVLGEYDRNGSPIQETVYLDNMPVVVLKPEQGSTVPYYIYADHINTPRVITRASDNAMVWRWDHADPFGVAAPDASLAGAVAFAYNPRFPGQLLDVESGLHQNYFRDYDPRAGRYVTSDPIGLDGGVNTYSYVENDPISYIDPLGLAKLPFSKLPGTKPPRWNPNTPGVGKPTYQVNLAHMPNSPKYNPRKTPEPADCQDVYKNAVPDDPYDPRHWWGRNSDGDFYRYNNSNDGTVHYSGTFTPRSLEVPPYVRSRLGY